MSNNIASYLPFPPQHDESARGLVVRLAESNLLPSRDMALWLDLPALTKGFDGGAEATAATLGIDSVAFAAMGFGKDGAEPFLGHPVPREMVKRHVMRVCPECLALSPYHRRIWDHQQIKVCPIHRTLLLENCRECPQGGGNGRIRWNRSSVAVGGCGHDLIAQRGADAGSCAGAAAVYRRCGLSCDGPDLPPAFASLPLQDLLDVLFFLGRMDVVVASGNPRHLKQKEMLTDPGILEAGAVIAFGWPGSFEDLARRIRAAYGDEVALTKQYDALHRFMAKCGDAPYAKLLRTAYASHLASRGDVSDRAWPAFLLKPKAIAATVTKTEAKEILGLGQSSFASLVRQPLWTDLVPLMPGRGGYQYDRADVLALKGKLDRLVTPGALDELLGIGRGKGAQLCDAGLLPFHMWNRHHRQGEGRSVDTADADAFFTRVSALALTVGPRRPVSFTVVLHRAAARRVLSFADVMRCILSGQLRGHLAAPGKPGFESLSFKEEDVIQVLDEISSPSRTGKMCLGDVVRALKLPAIAVHQLVKAKLLPEPIRHGGCLFDADAVEGFRASFVTDIEMARQKHAEPAEIRVAMRLMGARPVATVALRGKGTAAVYRRNDLG